MAVDLTEGKRYVYIFTWEEREASLSALEQRAFFGKMSEGAVLESAIKIEPSRSPFIRERIDVICEEKSFPDLLEAVSQLDEMPGEFKVSYVNRPELGASEKMRYPERRRLEKEVGMRVKGTASLTSPQLSLAVMNVKDRWVFGYHVPNDAVWLRHQQKPHSYSTALSTRVARAVVNIAAPRPRGMKLIDPCCGIGTVLVEARSMGIEIVGSDRNPLVMKGARENLAAFQLTGEVTLKDIHDVKGKYDVAIIDMPYNLCSVVSDEDKLSMLKSARSFTEKVVIVTLEEMDVMIEAAGFKITDRGDVRKGKFVREVLVCEASQV